MFKKKLRKIIKESGLTQEEFANATNVGRSTLYNYMNGRMPTMSFIQSLIKYDPEIDLNWLLKEEKYKTIEVESVVRESTHKSKNEYIKLLEKAVEGLKKIND